MYLNRSTRSNFDISWSHRKPSDLTGRLEKTHTITRKSNRYVRCRYRLLCTCTRESYYVFTIHLAYFVMFGLRVPPPKGRCAAGSWNNRHNMLFRHDCSVTLFFLNESAEHDCNEKSKQKKTCCGYAVMITT